MTSNAQRRLPVTGLDGFFWRNIPESALPNKTGDVEKMIASIVGKSDRTVRRWIKNTTAGPDTGEIEAIRLNFDQTN